MLDESLQSSREFCKSLNDLDSKIVVYPSHNKSLVSDKGFRIAEFDDVSSLDVKSFRFSKSRHVRMDHILLLGRDVRGSESCKVHENPTVGKQV